MTVTDIDRDYETLTLTLTADFDAEVERVWQLWADPRQLERWWGPPTYPATFEEHDLTPGGRVSYYMTSPEGEKFPGYWRVESVEPPHALEFSDGFADKDGTPSPDMPVTKTRVHLTARDSQTRMHILSSFQTREQMDQLVEMGMEEGLKQAVGQIDGLLADASASTRQG